MQLDSTILRCEDLMLCHVVCPFSFRPQFKKSGSIRTIFLLTVLFILIRKNITYFNMTDIEESIQVSNSIMDNICVTREKEKLAQILEEYPDLFDIMKKGKSIFRSNQLNYIVAQQNSKGTPRGIRLRTWRRTDATWRSSQGRS